MNQKKGKNVLFRNHVKNLTLSGVLRVIRPETGEEPGLFDIRAEDF
jgi:hypothetical protein